MQKFILYYWIRAGEQVSLQEELKNDLLFEQLHDGLNGKPR